MKDISYINICHDCIIHEELEVKKKAKVKTAKCSYCYWVTDVVRCKDIIKGE